MNDAQPALPILYSFRRCPYAMRARMALAYSKVAVEIREIALGDKPVAMVAISPKATVPVLQLPDGTVIEESLEIMRWALNQSDPADWQNTGRTLTAELILANDTSFKKNLDRYKYHSEKSEHPREHYQELAAEFLRHLERCLVRHGGKGLVRDSVSLADVAVFPFVRQFMATDPQWFDAAQLPNLHDWLDRHIQSKFFAQAMKKYPIWKAGGPGMVENWAPMRSADEEVVNLWIRKT